jgi:hypothetical protein
VASSADFELAITASLQMAIDRCVDRKTGAETTEGQPGWRTERMPSDRRNLRWTRVNLWRGHDYFYDGEAVREPSVAGHSSGQHVRNGNRQPGGRSGFGTGIPWDEQPGRSLRSVWSIASQPYPEAHFATFPEEIPRRCIAAGTSERGCCGACGAPWERVVERVEVGRQKMPDGWDTGPGGHGSFHRNGREAGATVPLMQRRPAGWRPTCSCEAGEPVPCTVLDLFAGSGTTVAVARLMGRRAVGIELQPAYLPLIQRRVAEASGPLLETHDGGHDDVQVEALPLFEESA